MAERTPVEWTHRPGTIGTTHTITMGCRKRSPGCGLPRWDGDLPGGCFAIREVVRQQHLPGRAGLVIRDSRGQLDWSGKVALLPERLRVPLTWRDPHTVFVNDLSELFDDDVPDAYIAAWWCVMWWTSTAGRRFHRPAAAAHTYLILGKNHARLRSWIRKWGVVESRARMVAEARDAGWATSDDVRNVHRMDAVLDNVWIGVSAERQAEADLRIPALLDTPAVVRFLSAEPLLGPLKVRKYLRPWPGYCQACGHELDPPQVTACLWCGAADDDDGPAAPAAPRLDWVIAGGESKPGCRPPHAEWFRDLRDQTIGAGRAFFFKQWGDWHPDAPPGWSAQPRQREGRQLLVWPDGQWRELSGLTGTEDQTFRLMHRVGKATAGAVLDGRTWREFPA